MADTKHTVSSPAIDSGARRRRIARDLLSEAEAVGHLLDSQTSAIGTDEILFLKRLRSSLIARAEELGQLGDERPTLARPQPIPTGNEMTAERRPIQEPPPPRERDRNGAYDMARIVTVSFLMFLFAFMGYLFAKSHLMHVDVTNEISDMLKIFMVPLVLLLLGFYFGTTRR